METGVDGARVEVGRGDLVYIGRGSKNIASNSFLWFMVGAASDYINGHVLAVDGGWLAR